MERSIQGKTTAMTTPEAIAERQCTPCGVDEPYASLIWAGGVLCGGCGRNRPKTQYRLESEVTAAVGKAVDRVRGEIDADEWRRLSPEARHAVNLLAQDVERRQADLAAAKAESEELRRQRDMDLLAVGTSQAAEEVARLQTELHAARAAGVAEGRTLERESIAEWLDDYGNTKVAGRYLGDAIRARTGKEQPDEH